MSKCNAMFFDSLDEYNFPKGLPPSLVLLHWQQRADDRSSQSVSC